MYHLADDFKSPSFGYLELDLKTVFDVPPDPEDPVYVVKEGDVEYQIKYDT